MNKKKIAIIFIILSIVFIGSLCGIFGYRLIHYYRLEHPKGKSESLLGDFLIRSNPIVTSGDGLYQEDETYVFKGNVATNYVKYSGMLWRAIEIGEAVTLVSDDALTSMVFGYEPTGFKDSYVYKWLNEIFLQKLTNTDYLVDTTYCIDSIQNANDVACKEKETSKVGMLSVYEYIKTGGSKGFLSNGKTFWTVNPSSDFKIWFINQKGLISDDSLLSDSYYSYGVRPVITVKKDSKILSGNGSKEDPYQFEVNTSKVLKEQTIGNYISYSDQVWRIMDIDDLGVKIILNGTLEIEKEFSETSNLYSIEKKDNLGYYLNSEYYESLQNKEYLVEYPWNISYYNANGNYQYPNEAIGTVKTEIGLLQVHDLFLNDVSGYALMTPSDETGNTIFTVQEDGRLYADMVTKKLKVRPVAVLKRNLTIVSGNGTLLDPFILGA